MIIVDTLQSLTCCRENEQKAALLLHDRGGTKIQQSKQSYHPYEEGKDESYCCGAKIENRLPPCFLCDNFAGAGYALQRENAPQREPVGHGVLLLVFLPTGVIHGFGVAVQLHL